jgi:IMP dehydrogenase/GMP reductase
MSIKSVPQEQEEQEIEITIISEENMKSYRNRSVDYRKTFLSTPKLEDRKPVFVSRETRDNLDKIVRRSGDRKMSVSGFIENLAKHHLKEYEDEINRLYRE